MPAGDIQEDCKAWKDSHHPGVVYACVYMGKCLHVLGKSGLLFLMEMCMVHTLQEGLCGVVSAPTVHALASSIPSVFHPAVSHTQSQHRGAYRLAE